MIYLINKKVDLFKIPYSENIEEHKVDLILYSNPRYIKLLASKGCKLSINNIDDIKYLIINGNIIKIMSLLNNKIITHNEILIILEKNPKLPFITLDKLYEKLFIICRDETDPIKLTNEIIDSYIQIFKLFQKFKINIDMIDEETGDILSQRILDSYIYELIKFMITCKPTFSQLIFNHYSNFDIINKQIMIPIYNNENYKKIYDLIKPYFIKKINRIKPKNNKKLLNV